MFLSGFCGLLRLGDTMEGRDGIVLVLTEKSGERVLYQAKGLALSQRPLARLAQDKEPWV